MPKQKKTQKVYCLEHEFLLSPLHQRLYFKQNICVSFCGGKIVHDSKKKVKKGHLHNSEKSCLVCPIFNQDNNPATNTFILPDQQNHFVQNYEQLYRQHEYKLMNYRLTLDEKSNMMVPKPKTRHSYCNACRKNYDDYLTHINSKQHKMSVNRSAFTQYILQFQCKYKNERQKALYIDDHNSIANCKKKASNQSVEVTIITIQDNNSEQIDGALPRKKVKRDQIYQHERIIDNMVVQKGQCNQHSPNGFIHPPASFINPLAIMSTLGINPYLAYQYSALPYYNNPFMHHQSARIPNFSQNVLSHQVNQNILNEYFTGNMRRAHNNFNPPVNQALNIEGHIILNNMIKNTMFVGNNFSPGMFNGSSYMGNQPENGRVPGQIKQQSFQPIIFGKNY